MRRRHRPAATTSAFEVPIKINLLYLSVHFRIKRIKNVNISVALIRLPDEKSKHFDKLKSKVKLDY